MNKDPKECFNLISHFYEIFRLKSHMFIQTDKKTCNICIICDCVGRETVIINNYDNNRLRLDLVQGTKVIRFN